MPWVWRATNLNTTAPTFEKVYPHPQLTVPNGAYYHSGSIFWAQEGNFTTPGGVVRMDPLTLETEVVLNNFFGHRFNLPNDIVVTEKSIAFFTDGYFGFDNFNDTLPPELANGVWRWNMNTGNMKMVAGAASGMLFNPNGVALDAAGDTLYVTNRGQTSADADGARTIYAWEVTSSGIRNGEVFAYVDAGFPDGIKLDEDGRVYAGVTGGVNVFSAEGTLLEKIKVLENDITWFTSE